MCTFLSVLPKKSKTAGTSKPQNLVISLRPCPDSPTEKEWYRFRLLNFSAQGTSTRDYPFITRFVHTKWRVNQKGYPEVEDEVVCPVTKWVNWAGDRYDCPICKFANQQWNALRQSNYRDSDARKKNKEFSRKFQAIIPVYVVNDPTYAGNNGKFKVIIFNDKKWYEDVFLKKLEAQLMKTNCFNGGQAADICFHVSMKETIVNENQPNQYVWKQKVIDQIAFTVPCTREAITMEKIEKELPFDKTYYVESTKAEIDAFYRKYIRVSTNDIIVDDVDSVTVYDPPQQSAPKLSQPVESATASAVEAPIIQSDEPDVKATISESELDDLTEDSDNAGLENGIQKSIPMAPASPIAQNSDKKMTMADVESMLDEME